MLTKKLKEELHINLYENLLKTSRIINEKLSDNTIRELSSFVREFSFAPEEEIFVKGDHAARLYFILHGGVI